MASVIEKAQTPADVHLAYALGVRRVAFGELSEAQQDDLLRTTLQSIDMRELRGFRPLRELLVFQPGSVTYGGPRIHTLDVETLQLQEGVTFPEGSPADLQTHALSLCRRYIEVRPVFKRHESEDETSEWHVASEWGRHGYHARGTTTALMLRRPRNHTPADENLLLVEVTYQKVPHEERHVITDLAVTNPRLDYLRGLGEGFPEVAIGIFDQLKRAYWTTVQELEHQLKRAQGVEAKLERIRSSLTE